MTRFANRKSTALLVTTTIATVVWVNAGSLAPPAGPVAPTMKPLDEIEPRIAIDAINTAGDAGSTSAAGDTSAVSPQISSVKCAG